jgi:hypothetical protein
MSWTLVIVSAKTCGACVRYYESQHSDLVESLKGLNVTLREIKYESVNASPPSGTPLDFVKLYVRWFPTFVLFTSEEWNYVNSNKFEIDGKPIVGRILNGKLTDKGATHESSGYPMTSAGVISWLKSFTSSKSAPAKTQKEENKVSLEPMYKTDLSAKEKLIKYLPTAPAHDSGLKTITCSNIYVSSHRR